MNGLPYYKAYPRDFVEGTIGMDFETKAAYRLILDFIYMQGGNLPDDPRYISGLLGCSMKKWASLRQRLIDSGKIEARGEFLANHRADKELETLGKLSEKQRKNRSRPNKNKELQSPPCDHTEPDTDTEKREANASQKKGRRLPADWLLPKAWGDWSIAQGMTEPQVRLEADRFRDYWISKSGRDGAKLDWQATWRNWSRNFIEKNPRKLIPITGGNLGKPDASTSRMDAFIAGSRGSPGMDRGAHPDPSQPLLAGR